MTPYKINKTNTGDVYAYKRAERRMRSKMFTANVLYWSIFNKFTNKWDLKCVKHRFIPVNSVNNICGFESQHDADCYAALIGE